MASCVDPNPERRNAFAQAWKVGKDYSDLDEALSARDYDVVSICSPSARHIEDLAQVLAARPKAVFCEKPIGTPLNTAKQTVRDYEREGVALAVNYSRRWDPEIRALAQAIQTGAWGTVRSATGFYTKGLLHNGAHMIDLLVQLLGKVQQINALHTIVDHNPDDPCVDAFLIMGDGVRVHLVVGDARDYPIFELMLVTEKGVVSIEQGGLTIRQRPAIDSPLFAGHRVIEDRPSQPGGAEAAMMAAITNIHDHITSGTPLASTGVTALASEQVCNELASAAQTE